MSVEVSDFDHEQAKIRQKMAETRSSLTEKLETLEQKVSTTVEGVTDTVASVTEVVKDTVETVKDSVQNTVEAVTGSVQSTVESVGDTFDLSKQVQQRPWVVFGGAVATGFLLGSLLGLGERRRSPVASSPAPSSPTPWLDKGPAERNGHHAVESTPSDSGSDDSWGMGILERFGPEIAKLKQLAIGSLFGLIKDTVQPMVPPAMASKATEIIDDFAHDMGAEPISMAPPADDIESHLNQPRMGKAMGT